MVFEGEKALMVREGLDELQLHVTDNGPRLRLLITLLHRLDDQADLAPTSLPPRSTSRPPRSHLAPTASLPTHSHHLASTTSLPPRSQHLAST